MQIPFAKPFLDVAGQIALLQSRGMQISDVAKATTCLERMGYYRLSGYWYPFRRFAVHSDPDGRPMRRTFDDFVPDTRFQDVHDLYVFDKRLRLLFLDAIERVEVGLRVDVALLLGKRSPWAHRDPSHLHPGFIQRSRPDGTVRFPHRDWLDKQDKQADRAREEFLLAFRAKYSSQLPLWMAIELWDFGLLSVLLGGMRHDDLAAIATKYGFPKRDYLTTATRSINYVRNVCAHHGRLWNRDLVDQPKLPRIGEIPLLDHMTSKGRAFSPANRVYAVAALLQFLLRTINPTAEWADRLKAHMLTFPSSRVIGVAQMGFPTGWETLSLWRH